MSTTLRYLGLAALLTTLGCSEPPAGPVGWMDVRPVLRARCLRCHGGGDTVAKVSFATREEAALAAAAALRAMRAKKMPPHGAAPEAEVRLIEAWVAQGTPP